MLLIYFFWIFLSYVTFFSFLSFWFSCRLNTKFEKSIFVISYLQSVCGFVFVMKNIFLDLFCLIFFIILNHKPQVISRLQSICGFIFTMKNLFLDFFCLIFLYCLKPWVSSDFMPTIHLWFYFYNEKSIVWRLRI